MSVGARRQTADDTAVSGVGEGVGEGVHLAGHQLFRCQKSRCQAKVLGMTRE